MSCPSRASLVVCLFSALTLFGADGTVRGELRDASGPLDQFTIHLINAQRGMEAERAFVSNLGSFQFQSVTPGSYLLEVRNQQGEVIKQQSVAVVGPMMEPSVSLASAHAPSSTPPHGMSSTVSVGQLRRDPDGRATREFNQAE